MRDNYQINLSSSEIITLASMLNAESIIGIKKADLRGWLGDSKSRIASAFEDLEEKQLIRYSFDGTLYINRVLKSLIKTMICPDKTLLVSYTHRNGNKENLCILKREEYTVKCVKRLGGDYTLTLLSEFEARDMIFDELLDSRTSPFKLTLSLENAEEAKRRIAAFDTDRAAELLSECSQGEVPVDIMTEVLSGGCSVMSARLRVRQGRLYTTVYRRLIVFTSAGSVSLCSDENDLITFTDADTESIAAQIMKIFRDEK